MGASYPGPAGKTPGSATPRLPRVSSPQTSSTNSCVPRRSAPRHPPDLPTPARAPERRTRPRPHSPSRSPPSPVRRRSCPPGGTGTPYAGLSQTCTDHLTQARDATRPPSPAHSAASTRRAPPLPSPRRRSRQPLPTAHTRAGTQPRRLHRAHEIHPAATPAAVGHGMPPAPHIQSVSMVSSAHR